VSIPKVAPADTPGAAPSPSRRGPLLAVAVTVLLWASAFVGIRYAAPWFSAGPLAFGRLLVGTVALGVLVLARREPLPRGRDWWPIVAIGVLWFGVYNVALNAGERLVDAGTAAMVINIGPVLIAVLAGLLLKEGFPRLLLAGLLVAFAGSVIVGLATSDAGGSSRPVLGVLLCLAAAVAYAVGVVLQKPVLARVSGIQVTFLGCAIGMVCTAGWAPQLVSELGQAPALASGTVVYLGLFPTAIAFSTWAYALRHLQAGRLGATTEGVPALVVVLAWVLLAEVPPWGALVGGALCLLGVGIARRR
jgi:drug/metabolite transporter (DMT)-like permease